MGQDKGKIPGNSVFQGGDSGGFGEPLLVGAPAHQQIAEALHHNAAAGEHVAQLGDIPAVFDGLVKRLGEFGRNQHGEIGVFRVLVLVGVAVAVDHGDSLAAYAAFIMLLADDASRIHAEGADLILKGI